MEKAAILEDFEKSGCDTLILSEERLSFPLYEKFSRIKDLASDLEITVICYLRRPDYLMESLWNQHCKNGIEKRNILQFSRSEFSLRGLEYCKILNFWSEFAHVNAVNFDDAKKHGVASVFAQLAGIKLEKEAPSINVSPSMNCATVLAALNHSKKPFNKTRLLQAFREDRQKFALGSVRRKEILDILEEDLKALQKTYGVSFDMTMPEERAAPLLRPSAESLALAFAHLCPPS